HDFKTPTGFGFSNCPQSGPATNPEDAGRRDAPPPASGFVICSNTNDDSYKSQKYSHTFVIWYKAEK
ncbi:MAG: hypothetical protein ACK6C7_00375, partial [Pseudanabaena sp.]